MSPWSPKAYQVLAILDNPTSKSLLKSSQEINKCISMDGDHVSYQVLAILENPTSKPPPKGSQEINKCISMDGDHLPYQVLA